MAGLGGRQNSSISLNQGSLGNGHPWQVKREGTAVAGGTWQKTVWMVRFSKLWGRSGGREINKVGRTHPASC